MLSFLTAGYTCSGDFGMMKPPESVNTGTSPFRPPRAVPSHLRNFERNLNVGTISCGVPDRLLADVLNAVASSTNEREFG